MHIFRFFKNIVEYNESQMLADYLGDHQDKQFEQFFKDHVITHLVRQIRQDPQLRVRMEQGRPIGTDDRDSAALRAVDTLRLPVHVQQEWSKPLEDILEYYVDKASNMQIAFSRIRHPTQQDVNANQQQMEAINVKAVAVKGLMAKIEEGITQGNIHERPLPNFSY